MGRVSLTAYTAAMNDSEPGAALIVWLADAGRPRFTGRECGGSPAECLIRLNSSRAKPIPDR